jgi:uncharacterized membrane protein YgcG
MPADLLAAMTAAAPVLAALIQPAQQQQQQQHRQQQKDGISCAGMLAVTVLHVWDQSVSTLVADRVHVPASSMAAMSRLVAAALKTQFAGNSSSRCDSALNTGSGTATGAGSSSSSSDPQPATGSSNSIAATAAVADALFAANLQLRKANYSSMQLKASAAAAAYALAVSFEPYTQPASGDTSDSLWRLSAVDPTAAANIGWVLYVNLAWLVQRQQQQLSRTHASSSSRVQSQQSMRQARVPPWHVQFLAAVGVPAWRADWRPGCTRPPTEVMIRQLQTLHHRRLMLQMTGGGGQGNSSTGAAGPHGHSSSSSSGGDGESGSSLLSKARQQQGSVSQQLLFEELLPAREALLLLLEVILLDPGSSARRVTTMMICHPRMQELWDRLQQESSDASAHETADAMLQLVLHLLGPAVLQQLEASSSGSNNEAAPSAWGSEDLARWFAKLTEWLVAAGAMPLC